ncbi:hypothetical protein BDV36DRAFT_295979 [Aspergillus pseudocaelatus]|uniref:DUF4396 domain-containing protein n=1 Tax=Aspergillus pseudocaelatus TaxID=1825620 RepID=A0ABQ6WKC4_9EURO|nr:hypothetical protein BDV36DRAFT_295979 [Aspergillus pseudocaelatus]
MQMYDTTIYIKTSFLDRQVDLVQSRCEYPPLLVGCTMGDFSALRLLQSFCPEMGMGVVMGVSILLVRGKDRPPWKHAFKTACGMSFISILAMESVQNVVDYHLTGGCRYAGRPGILGGGSGSYGGWLFGSVAVELL